jgi:hypothetical protein
MLITFAVAFVTPGIHYEKNEDHEAEDEENERSGPILPELLQAVCNVIRVHAAANLHPGREIRNLEIYEPKRAALR